MGNEVSRGHNLTLNARSPVPAKFVVFRNGEQFASFANVAEIVATPSEPGTYRVEVYLDQLGSPFDKMPWIISNPIYVR